MADEIRTTIRRIIRGLGTLPEYGSHPGWPVIWMLLTISVLVGASRGGWRGAIIVTIAMASWSLPLLLYGAWDRARDAERFSHE